LFKRLALNAGLSLGDPVFADAPIVTDAEILFVATQQDAKRRRSGFSWATLVIRRYDASFEALAHERCFTNRSEFCQFIPK
jgi:hypothetical protein